MFNSLWINEGDVYVMDIKGMYYRYKLCCGNYKYVDFSVFWKMWYERS